MVSRVFSNHNHDIHWPSTPEKEVTERRHREKDCETATESATESATDSKAYACSDIDLSAVLFYGLIF